MGAVFLQRIKIAEILEDEWFKKGYKPPHFEKAKMLTLTTLMLHSMVQRYYIDQMFILNLRLSWKSSQKYYVLQKQFYILFYVHIIIQVHSCYNMNFFVSSFLEDQVEKF